MSLRPAFIAIIGTGTVGKSFVNQLRAYTESNPYRPIFTILVSKSNKALISRDFTGLSLANWESDLASSNSKPFEFPNGLISWLKSAPGDVILVDNTSNDDIGKAYPQILREGIHIVTPNKKAFSSDLALWDAIQDARSPTGDKGGIIFHEATVGAGLPVLTTLRDLLLTGDKIRKIEGVFSGTMSFLFNTFHPANGSSSQKFSDIVKVAQQSGFTEPDPRDDLNGLDVARKLTILARLSGLKVQSPTSFPIESLVPKELEAVATADEFLTKLPDFDSVIEERKSKADKEGKVLRYVGSLNVESGDVSVGIQEFPRDSAIAGLKGADNIISFTTERYGDNPLIIQGAGAGAEVTAMGVLADLLRVFERL